LERELRNGNGRGIATSSTIASHATWRFLPVPFAPATIFDSMTNKVKAMFQPDAARHSSDPSSRTDALRRAAWTRTAIAVAIAAFSTAAAARDNRPAAPDFSHAPAATQAMLVKAKPVTAKHAMVVSDQHLATDAGVQILKEGGNAIDAAVAVGYALAVTQPCCGNIGGGGVMTIHLKDGQ